MTCIVILNEPSCSDLYEGAVFDFLADDENAQASLIFLCQANASVLQALKLCFPKHEIISVDDQKRSIVELLLFITLCGVQFSNFHVLGESSLSGKDPNKEGIINRAASLGRLIKQVEALSTSDKCLGGALSELDQFIDDVRPLAQSFASHASILVGALKNIRSADSKFYLGAVDSTPGALSAASWRNFSSYNGYRELAEDYGVIVRRTSYFSDFLEGRRHAAFFLRSGLSEINPLNVVNYYRFLSAYSFSQSLRLQGMNEPNLEFLWTFRSLEFGLFSWALDNSLIEVNQSHDGKLEFLFNGRKVSGVGDLFYKVRATLVHGSVSAIPGIVAMISLRNISFVGHQWLHVSCPIAAELRSSVREFLKSVFTHEHFCGWAKDQQSCRPHKCGDIVDLFRIHEKHAI